MKIKWTLLLLILTITLPLWAGDQAIEEVQYPYFNKGTFSFPWGLVIKFPTEQSHLSSIIPQKENLVFPVQIKFPEMNKFVQQDIIASRTMTIQTGAEKTLNLRLPSGRGAEINWVIGGPTVTFEINNPLQRPLGSILYPKRSKEIKEYIGEFQQGFPNGVGMLYYKDNRILYGNFKHNVNHGTFINPKEMEIIQFTIGNEKEHISFKGKKGCRLKGWGTFYSPLKLCQGHQKKTWGISFSPPRILKEAEIKNNKIISGEMISLDPVSLSTNYGKVYMGKLVGRSFYSKNDTIYLGEMIAGKMHGDGIFINKNKFEIMQGSFVKNKRQGNFKIFHPNGELLKKASYKNDHLHGEIYDYFPGTGMRVKSVSRYQNGKLKGPFKEFDIDGKIIKSGNH